MGYTSEHISGTIKQWWEASFMRDDNYELIDSSIVHFNTMYSAVKYKPTGKVICFVTLLSYNRHDYNNLTHKTICETSGPNQIDCPQKIFKLLTPLNDENDPNGWGREWRIKVKRGYDIRRYVNSGKLIKLKKGIRFSNGATYKYFVKKNRQLYTIDIITGAIINKVYLNIKTIIYNFESLV